MIEDDRATEIEPGARAAAFAVAPVHRRRGSASLIVAAAAVALSAFLAGLVIASPDGAPVDRLPALAATQEPSSRPGSSPLTGADASASALQSAPERAPALGPGPGPGLTPGGGAPGGDASPAAVPSRPASTAAPGSSGFLADFEPAAVMASVDPGRVCEAGSPLEKGAPRTRVDGPRLTFQRSWLVYCRIPVDERQAFLVDVFQALRPEIPAETYAYGTTGDGAGNALYPYADRPMAGTVAVHADAAGEGLAIVVIVEEWRTG
jgi:hypothetical protein